MGGVGTSEASMSVTFAWMDVNMTDLGFLRFNAVRRVRKDQRECALSVSSEPSNNIRLRVYDRPIKDISRAIIL